MVKPYSISGETRAIPFLRRTTSDPAHRRPWDRTVKTFENRGLTPNFRSYFDRYRDVSEMGGPQAPLEEQLALGKNAIPKPRKLVPLWSLRYISEDELPPENRNKIGEPPLSRQAAERRRRNRWNQHFGLMLDNEGLHQNLRNYFDRRRDREDPGKAHAVHEKENPRPTWSLQDYSGKPSFCVDVPSDESKRKKEEKWVRTSNLSALNSHLHRDVRMYFRKEPLIDWKASKADAN